MANKDDMVKWILTDYEYFHTMEEKDPSTLYFLDDTKEIYKGDINFSKSAVKLNAAEDFPEYGGEKLYIYDNKLYMQINGTWEIVLNGDSGKDDEPIVPPSVDPIIILEAIDPDNLTGEAVSDRAVVDYVVEYINNLDLTPEVPPAPEVEPDTTETVLTTAAITVEQDTGIYAAGTIIPKGTSVQTILENMCKRIPPPIVYTKPTMNATYVPNTSSVESGTSISSITVTPSFVQNDGGPINQIVVSYNLNGGTTTEVYRGTELKPVVTPSMVVQSSLKINVSISYDGNDHIAAGTLSKSKTISAVTYIYYVADTDNGVDIDENALSTFTKTASSSKEVSVTCEVGDSRVLFLLPNGKTISKVTSTNLGYNVLATFAKSTIEINGATYNLYLYETEIAFPAEDIYVATIV